MHWGPADSLKVDAETIGGSSLPLTLDRRGLLPRLVQQYPDYEGYESLRLAKKDARAAAKIARAGQVAVAAYDDLGRLVQATNVEIVGRVGR